MPIFDIGHAVGFISRESGIVGFICGILIGVGIVLLLGIRIRKPLIGKNTKTK